MSRSNLKKNKKKIYVKIKCYLPELKYLESWRDFHKSDQMVCILITIGSPLAKFHTYIYFSIPTSPTSFLWWHDNFANVDLGSVWIQLILLKIDNWKHCNKIIFKYVNNAVRPNFNEKFVEKNTCGAREQCTWPTKLDANTTKTKFQIYPNSRLAYSWL